MLLDHFHPSLSETRHWSGFHSQWAGTITADLNRRLPEGWVAEPTVSWGIEVDVSTFEEDSARTTWGTSSQEWIPPEPSRTIAIPAQSDEAGVYVSAYRPICTDDGIDLSIWYEDLAVGSGLPSMPLFLRDGPCVRLDLQTTYHQTCRDLRIPVNEGGDRDGLPPRTHNG